MASKKLPLVKMSINPKKGSHVDAISIVDRPAIKSTFLAFSKDEEPIKLVFADEKQELIGAAMIPGVPMYRNTPGVGEYMSVFDAETIREIAQVFAEKGFHNNMNLNHSETPAGSFVFQSYITDPDKGINAPVGIDVPPGSWIIGVKVNDAEVWKGIKDGKGTGFSVEGIFGLIDTGLDLELIKLAQEFDDALDASPKGCIMFVPNIDLARWELQARTLCPGASQIETMPHVTILYGVLDDPEIIPALKSFFAEALQEFPIMIEFGALGKFSNDGKDDAIYIGINDCNGGISAINTILSSMLGVVSDYPDFVPHMTLAYQTPDPSTTFSIDPVYPWEFGANYLNKGVIVYSDAENNITELLNIK